MLNRLFVVFCCVISLTLVGCDASEERCQQEHYFVDFGVDCKQISSIDTYLSQEKTEPVVIPVASPDEIQTAIAENLKLGHELYENELFYRSVQDSVFVVSPFELTQTIFQQELAVPLLEDINSSFLNLEGNNSHASNYHWNQALWSNTSPELVQRNNQAWLQQAYPFSKNYLRELESFYSTTLHSADFLNDSEPVSAAVDSSRRIFFDNQSQLNLNWDPSLAVSTVNDGTFITPKSVNNSQLYYDEVVMPNTKKQYYQYEIDLFNQKQVDESLHINYNDYMSGYFSPKSMCYLHMPVVENPLIALQDDGLNLSPDSYDAYMQEHLPSMQVGGEAIIPLMTLEGEMLNVSTEGYDAYQVPLHNTSLALTIIIPATEQLYSVENDYLKGELQNLNDLMQKSHVSLSLPCINIQSFGAEYSNYDSFWRINQLEDDVLQLYKNSDDKSIIHSSKLKLNDLGLGSDFSSRVDYEATKIEEHYNDGFDSGLNMSAVTDFINCNGRVVDYKAPLTSENQSRPFIFALQDTNTNTVLQLGHVYSIKDLSTQQLQCSVSND